MWQKCDKNVTKMWQKCDKNVTKMWQICALAAQLAAWGCPAGCLRLENVDFLKVFFRFPPESIVLLKLFNVLSPDHRFLQRFCDLWVARPTGPERGGKCDKNVTKMWQKMWRKCNKNVTKMWQKCNKNVKNMWQKCDKNVKNMWNTWHWVSISCPAGCLRLPSWVSEVRKRGFSLGFL